MPDENGIPQPWNARVSSVEAGIGLPGFAGIWIIDKTIGCREGAAINCIDAVAYDSEARS
jgi:hypothetical protein